MARFHAEDVKKCKREIDIYFINGGKDSEELLKMLKGKYSQAVIDEASKSIGRLDW